MNKGIILKILSEYAYVLFEKNLYECKATGKIRHSNIKPTTGDYVEFEIIDEKNFKGSLTNILERKNELYRPRIANIDQVVIITSLRDPLLNTYTLNKYLFFVELLNIKPVLAFTKVDLTQDNDEELVKANAYKKFGYEVYLINNMIKTDKEWMSFLKSLENKTSVFTGQTGAGKSTTLNHIIPNLFEKTQEISKALNRGKHTTTKNELFIYKDALIGDTPGFSSFEYKEISQEEIAMSINFFKQANCKFTNCLHINKTPGCNVIKAVENNKFPDFIYKDYVKVQLEIEDQNKRRKY
ncbi:ribosome small subunit-dependent GTPase A [Spiroplasma diminutum]|uniref:Small ribosomal subunit biogenesis GTPase RsgA n=1 Tax=Spiroplasma diminutum CUAS-1 TaxID=1276221 RepID=S5M0K4_9MOLU|nr:ribosome small subunit-dependent GTPase A [Spiroplasma diminutum]AGR42391.1 ribosome biogenesis GTPase [Spiroplasma diminutum CUAS-1]